MANRSSSRRRILGACAVGAGAFLIGRQMLRRSRRIDLAGRTVLITGGSRGLGLALARDFGRRRARVAICARDVAELDAARIDLGGRGVNAQTFCCDLRQPEEVFRLIEQVESACGDIDVLVNNAATITVGPAQQMTIEDFQEAMNANFWPAVNASLALIPKMKRRRFGRIVNIASVGGKMPVPHLAPYTASKFALVGFSGVMRSEFAKDGVLITTVNPGLMRTGSPRNATFKGKHREEYGWFSIADALPGTSMSAERAARRIVDAAIDGEAEIVLGIPAKLASTSYGLFPNLFVEITGLVDRLLPNADSAHQSVKSGADSESWITQSIVRYLGRRAEKDLNQMKTL